MKHIYFAPAVIFFCFLSEVQGGSQIQNDTLNKTFKIINNLKTDQQWPILDCILKIKIDSVNSDAALAFQEQVLQRTHILKSLFLQARMQAKLERLIEKKLKKTYAAYIHEFPTLNQSEFPSIEQKTTLLQQAISEPTENQKKFCYFLGVFSMGKVNKTFFEQLITTLNSCRPQDARIGLHNFLHDWMQIQKSSRSEKNLLDFLNLVHKLKTQQLKQQALQTFTLYLLDRAKNIIPGTKLLQIIGKEIPAKIDQKELLAYTATRYAKKWKNSALREKTYEEFWESLKLCKNQEL